MAALILAASPPAWAHSDASVSSLAPGMPITPTSLVGLDGKSYTIPSEGPEVVLFWSLYDAQPLPSMFAMLQKLDHAFKGRVRFRAVNLDSKALVRNLPDRVKARAASVKPAAPMILDPLRYSRDEFHLKRTPAMVILKDARIEGFYSFDHAEDARIVEDTLQRLAPRN
jgi:hypothetical protein